MCMKQNYCILTILVLKVVHVEPFQNMLVLMALLA